METEVVKIRPIKLIAEIFTTIAAVLLIVAVAGPEWAQARFNFGQEMQTWNWGLWERCNIVLTEQNVCIEEDWLTVCAVFVIISLLLCIVCGACGLVGLLSDYQPKKKIYYLACGIGMIASAVVVLLALIIFPVKFGENIRTYDDLDRWDFDWTYGFGWGGFVFQLAAAVFFLLPNPSSEDNTKAYYQ